MNKWERTAIIMRIGAVCICALILISGRPPSRAQSRAYMPIVPTEQVITQKDEQRDLDMNDMKKFQSQQLDWNKQTGDQVGVLATKIDDAHDQALQTAWLIKGGMGAITVMTFLAGYFSLKKGRV